MTQNALTLSVLLEVALLCGDPLAAEGQVPQPENEATAGTETPGEGMSSDDQRNALYVELLGSGGGPPSTTSVNFPPE